MNLKSIFVTAAAVAAFSVPAMAQLYTMGTAGPNANSPAGTYGITFHVNTGVDLSITGVGLFDYGIYGTGIGTISLWRDGDLTPLFTTTIDLDTDGSTAYDFIMKSVTPINLNPVDEYALVWRNNSGSLSQPYADSGLTQNSTGVYNQVGFAHIYNHTGAPFDTSPFLDVGSLGAYSVPFASVNMVLAPTAVPEPSEYAAVAGLGLVAFAAFRKFRR